MTQTDDGRINLTINGREVTTRPGRMLIDVAEELDIFVPRFCYHPGLESVAACRMCLVEVEGSRRPLDPACATPVTDGMVVKTDSQVASEAQESVLELLLINHPLDCPICDRGGECPLQDQALNFGPGMSRYREEKRHFPKPIPISDLVMLDRERCVLCWRCVRFCDEVSGDTFIDLMDRGSLTQINTAEGTPFNSYFSGNTIQICPVGALTGKPYRFLSRPWDLIATESTCSFCSVGCPISIEQRGGEIQRSQALPNDNVNSFWNCDKGRFGHRYPSHPDRLKAPLIRSVSESGRQQFVEVDWDEALDRIGDRLRAVVESDGPAAVGFVGGSHATNEDLFGAAKFFREVVGTPNLDFRVFDAGFDYEQFFGPGVIGSTATIDDLDSAKTILWIGPDPIEELPVLFLRLRRAILKGARLIVVHPRRIKLAALGTHLPYRPGGLADLLSELTGVGTENYAEAKSALREGPVVVCIGQQFVGMSSAESGEAFRNLAEQIDAKILLCVPNANSQGALDMGVYPGLGWGHRPASPGLNTGSTLEAAADGRLKFLWVLGADLTKDFPDAELVERAFRSEAFIVTTELFPTGTALASDVLLPAASFAEKQGSFTNLERRSQLVDAAIQPAGSARAEWHIFSDLASRFAEGWGWLSAKDVANEIAQTVPTHKDFSWKNLSQPPSSLRDVVQLPPEFGHAVGQSGNPSGSGLEREGLDPRVSRGSETAWPLRWELRAVDATRRSGWIWDLSEIGEVAGPSQNTSARPGTPTASLASRPSNSGSLVLLVQRALYDAGQMVSRSEELAPLRLEPFVELHPRDATARGLQAGDEVRVVSDRGELRLKLRVSEDTPAGSAFMLFDQPEAAANRLMDSAEAMSYVEVFR
jgi:NADH-quinone oxidoreductase subunit G